MRIAINFERVDPNRGGAETYVADLCRGLVRAGHAPTLFAAEWREGAIGEGVAIERIPSRGRTRTERILRFAEDSERALRERRGEFDAIAGFINTWYQDVLIPQGGVRAASVECNARRFRSRAARWVYRLAKGAGPRARLYDAIERRQYGPGGARLVVAVSRFVAGHLRRFHGVPEDRIRVIPNAIDAGRLASADREGIRARARAAFGLGAGDVAGLFVGHNYKLKGLYPLLEALAWRKRTRGGRPLKLIVSGGGRTEPARRAAARLGIEGETRFIGFHPDIRECYYAADFFVSPTYYDPCSLVVFEALACGLPVITTAMNGAGEAIAQGGEGFVIPTPDDREALAAALEAMTDDAARGEMSGRAARLGWEQSFERHLGRMIGVFEEAAASRASEA